MNVLVVGGAGYIGSHTVRALKDAGHKPVVFDNLVNGHTESADRLGVQLIEGDICNRADLGLAFASMPFDAVVHFAAYAYVGESVRRPEMYYANNVAGTLTLLEAMLEAHVDKIVFSSSCATYGNPQAQTLDETHPQRPINPYGRTKLISEWMLQDFDLAYGIRHVALRYFNAAGASRDGVLGEDHKVETHLIPLCLQAASGVNEKITIFGTDYDTPDGTCIRDYIHVEDLASAHVLALEYLAEGNPSVQLNVGTGKGYSVREVVHVSTAVSGHSIPVVLGSRRPGDPARLIADARRIRELFGWTPKYNDLESIVRTAWGWFETGGRY